MTARKRRADAVRNRELILTAAYEMFAAEGFNVPVDVIAGHAGVGAGTIYRHFPTKDALIRAVVDHRLTQLTLRAERLIAREGDAGAFFAFLEATIADGAADQGLADAFSQSAADSGETSDAETGLMSVLDRLLRGAQAAGGVRDDLDAADIKALLVGHQRLTRYRNDPDSDKTLFDVLKRGLAP